jgi:hypothetical protein
MGRPKQASIDLAYACVSASGCALQASHSGPRTSRQPPLRCPATAPQNAGAGSWPDPAHPGRAGGSTHLEPHARDPHAYGVCPHKNHGPCAFQNLGRGQHSESYSSPKCKAHSSRNRDNEFAIDGVSNLPATLGRFLAEHSQYPGFQYDVVQDDVRGG